MAVLQELLRSQEDPWTKSWLDIQREIGIITNFQSKLTLQNALQHMSIRNIMRTKQVHSTMEVVPQPLEWFKLQGHVSDSRASRDLCCVRGGNTLLGNRFKNRYGKKYESCPFFLGATGQSVKLRESHVLFACPAVSQHRRSLGLAAYKTRLDAPANLSNQQLLRSYLGGDGASKMELLKRGRAMGIIIETWLQRTHV